RWRDRREELRWSERVRTGREKEQREHRRRARRVLLDQRSRPLRPQRGETASEGPEQRSENDAHGGGRDAKKRPEGKDARRGCTSPASVPLASPGTACPSRMPATPERPTTATRAAAERAPRSSRNGSATAAVSGAWWARIASCTSVARSLDCTTASSARPSTTEWKTRAMKATSAATRR